MLANQSLYWTLDLYVPLAIPIGKIIYILNSRPLVSLDIPTATVFSDVSKAAVGTYFVTISKMLTCHRNFDPLD